MYLDNGLNIYDYIVIMFSIYLICFQTVFCYINVRKRHVGDLGNIEVNEEGNVETIIEDDAVSLSGEFSVIGRAIVVRLMTIKLVWTNHSHNYSF